MPVRPVHDHTEYTPDEGVTWTLDLEEAKKLAGKTGTVQSREVYFSPLETVEE